MLLQSTPSIGIIPARRFDGDDNIDELTFGVVRGSRRQVDAAGEKLGRRL